MTFGRTETQSNAPDFAPDGELWNAASEQALLGAILIENRVLDRVRAFLREDHFHHPVHAAIYRACLVFRDKGMTANPVTLKDVARDDPLLASAGGPNYLVDLVAAVVTIFNAEDYAYQVRDLALRRRLVALGEDIAREAALVRLDGDVADEIARADAALAEIALDHQEKNGAAALGPTLEAAIARLESVYKGEREPGLPLGFAALDALVGGARPHQLLILGGRPSMGKTALALAIAGRVSALGRPVAFFSLETSADMLAARLAAAEADVPLHDLNRGRVDADAFDRVIEAGRTLRSRPLFFDETGVQTLWSLRSEALRLKRRHGLGLIVIDYLQLLSTPRDERRFGNKTAEITDISRGLKLLSKTLETPVLALSQLSRQVEARADKRPGLADLRESGAIEQDADVVLFVYRDAYYRAREGFDPGAGEAYGGSYGGSYGGGFGGGASGEPALGGLRGYMAGRHRASGGDRASGGENARRPANDESDEGSGDGSGDRVLEVLVRKNKDGPIGVCRLFYDETTQRVDDLPSASPEPDYGRRARLTAGAGVERFGGGVDG